MGSSQSPSETVVGTVSLSVQIDVPEHYTDAEIKQAIRENYKYGTILGVDIESR